MSMFKNTVTGDVTTVFGPVHDNFLTRAGEELIFDDRDGKRDPSVEGLDVHLDAAAEPEAEAETSDPDTADKKSAASQTTTTDADGVATTKE